MTVENLIVALYVVIGLVVGVIAARRWTDVHPIHDMDRYADYATAAFLCLCVAAVWPMILAFIGLGAVITLGKKA